MGALILKNVTKSYNDIRAVRGIDLRIEAGEFAVLVGRSGCGKSTLLRSIAGLEEITEGSVRLGELDLTGLAPSRRNLAMVFQSYALYPFLSVFENIAFGLRARKVPQKEIEIKVMAAASLLALTDYLDRKPKSLSGGQRQRVAIGRAIVRDAELFLFDEPLSNLDAKLRDEMREELKKLHQRMGKTFVYVTHDQIEAMTLADRIVLLKDGEIEQQGAPLELFERPVNKFVGGFLGSPSMNFLQVRVDAPSQALVLTDGQVIAWHGSLSSLSGRSLHWGVRPEHFSLDNAERPSLQASISVLQPTGSRIYGSFMIKDDHVVAELDAHRLQPGQRELVLGVATERTVLFDPDTGAAIWNSNIDGVK